MKYRKKPVVIDAMQVPKMEPTLLPQDLNDEQAVFSAWMFSHKKVSWTGHYNGKIDIETLEGIMTANPGDWVIRGVEGELYPCNSAIFKQTYEKVE